MLHVSHPTGPVAKKIDKVKLFLEKIGKFQEKYPVKKWPLMKRC